MNVPFHDLRADPFAEDDEIMNAIRRVMDSSRFCNNRETRAFEQEFAAFCEVPEAVAVDSGTEALWLSLLALGIGRGDEVITVANTFVATVEAILATGARPVFADVRASDGLLDPATLETVTTSRTKAVIPVHLHGKCVAAARLRTAAMSLGLHVIEDACQAHGAGMPGMLAGSLGTAGCFSFYPSKNLGGAGDSGAVTTRDPDLAATLRSMRDHGRGVHRHRHGRFGWNSRMDEVQAAVLRVRLRFLEARNRLRRDAANRYRDLLVDLPRIEFDPDPVEHHACHIFAIRTDERDRLASRLRRHGIETRVHYPVPLHRQPACADAIIPAGGLPVTERLANRQLSLPLYPGITSRQIDFVARRLAREVAHVRVPAPTTAPAPATLPST